MKNKLIFILWLLMFSFFSCDFGIKENEETNSKEYFTVKGSCSIQGAIPSDLLPEKSIKQNAQRTVVPEEIAPDVITVIFESETGETKSVEVENNNGVLNFEIELPAGKWTVKAQGKKSDVVIIESESCQIELSAENKSTNVELVLKPIQSDTGEGTFNFSFGENHYTVSGMKYTYKKNGATEPKSAIINGFSEQNIKLSSGVYTFRFDFYSDMDCIDELLYSFTEVVNIFDGFTTDTWITAGEYINDEGEICITDTMISKFVSTTVYVSTAGDDTNLGTFFAPVRTIQKAVDKVIAMNVVTPSNEVNPYKILLLSDIETSSDISFENNNALVNIDPSSTLYLEISKYGDGNATINANRTDYNTGRVMYIGENANVTLKNLTLKGGYLIDENGGGIYSKGNCKLNSCTISGNTAKVLSGSVNGGGVYIESGSFTISGNASITEDNDVYLTKDQKITITGELSSDTVARITPENYAEDVKVLAAGTGNNLNEEVRGKFKVTKYSNNVETEITDEGSLKNTLTLGENAELTEDLYNICSTINVTSADGMNALSTLSPPENAGNPGQTFKGKTINLKAHVKLDTEYKPIHTFSGVFDGGGYSIEINAPTIYDWDSPKGKALFYVVTGENAEIKNLIVKGTAEGAGIAYELTEKAKISNCKSWVNITTKGNNYPTPGGIVSNLNNGSRIENCENNGTIICNEKNTGGGIVGDMSFYTRNGEDNCRDYTVIANCTNYGDVIIEDVTGVVKMGGICGEFSFGTIFNCANKGEVTVTDEDNSEHEILGGIVGICRGEKIDGIINCYNSGKIYSRSSNSDNQNIGGIVGEGYVGLYNYNQVYYKIRVTNTVNNDDTTYFIGNVENYDNSADFDITNNFYKKPGESTYDVNNIDTVIDTLNKYSDNSGRKYLKWGKDSNGNIVFSEEIIGN